MTLRAFILGDNFSPVTESVGQTGAVNYTATITVYYFNPVTEQEINQTYPITVGVSKNIDVKSGYDVTLKCVAKSGFKFNSANTLDNKSIAFTDSNINYKFPDSALISSLNDPRSIIIKTAENIVVPNFITGDTVNSSGEVSQTGEAHYTAKVVAEFFNPVTEQTTTKEYSLVLGDPLPIDVSGADSVFFVASANDGYVFSGASYAGNDIAYTDSSINYKLTNAQLNSTDDKQRSFYIQVKAEAPTPQPTESFINLYNPTVSEYLDLQKAVYSSADPTSQNTKPWEFISSAIELPFTLPESAIGLKENLKAGTWTYNLMNRVLSPIFELDLGTIEIPPKYNNALDYYNVKVDLYLPFKNGNISLDVNLVMGKLLSVKYQIVGTDGNVTANIYADGVLISVNQFNIGVSVPFYSFYNTISKTYEPNTVNNGVFSAYVIIQWPDYDSEIPARVEVEGLLLNSSGNISVNEIEIKNIQYADEYDLILSILRSGIIIK